MLKVDTNILKWWLWEMDDKILQETSIEVDFSDFEIFGDVENEWSKNIFGLVCTFLCDGDSSSWL